MCINFIQIMSQTTGPLVITYIHLSLVLNCVDLTYYKVFLNRL